MIVVTLKILEICEDTCDKNVSIKVLQRFNLRLDIKLKTTIIVVRGKPLYCFFSVSIRKSSDARAFAPMSD